MTVSIHSSAVMVLVTAVMIWTTGCTSAESSENEGSLALPNPQELTAEIEPSSEAPPPDPVEDPKPAEPKVVTIPAGTLMTFLLTNSLSTESNQVGDRFSATLASDVAASDGGALVAAGAYAEGLVVVSQESQSADVPAVLELDLEAIEVGGQMLLVEALVVATELESETRDSGGETAAKIGIGTAAGALVGGLIGGDRRGTLIGAGAGAVAGTAVAVSTDEGHAVLAEGSSVTITLEEPLVLPRPEW